MQWLLGNATRAPDDVQQHTEVGRGTAWQWCSEDDLRLSLCFPTARGARRGRAAKGLLSTFLTGPRTRRVGIATDRLAATAFRFDFDNVLAAWPWPRPGVRLVVRLDFLGKPGGGASDLLLAWKFADLEALCFLLACRVSSLVALGPFWALGKSRDEELKLFLALGISSNGAFWVFLPPAILRNDALDEFLVLGIRRSDALGVFTLPGIWRNDAPDVLLALGISSSDALSAFLTLGI